MNPKEGQKPTGLDTDLYELTMAQGFWRKGLGEQLACFHMFTRNNPFGNGFSLAAGLASLVELLGNFTYNEAALAYLANLEAPMGVKLFQPKFIEYLKNLQFKLSLYAMPEGTVFFPHEPILRVEGPLIQCQLVETLLLNTINYQSLIATKAARIYLAAGGNEVVEFGMRRAHGLNGALSASRAAYIGGCVATSNIAAGAKFDIPVQGTHAHSWVLAFPSEVEAFKAYAEEYPESLVLLVDTYDTHEGVRNAIKLAQSLPNPKKLLGIRLDSGDLTYFSIYARAELDKAGLTQTKIIASNDLDEYLIEHLRMQKARIDVWGVGTKLITAAGDSSLKGVYKLTALKQGKNWTAKVKISNDYAKINHPGLMQIRRFLEGKKYIGDAIYSLDLPLPKIWEITDPTNPWAHKRFMPNQSYQELLVPILKSGQLVSDLPSATEARLHTLANLEALDPSVKRLVNPHLYPAGLENTSFNRKMQITGSLSAHF